MRRGGTAITFALATVLASLQLAGSCVDGVTPDCSDAATCAPSSGDAGGDAALVSPEASTEADGSPDAGLADADADASGG